MSAASTNVPVSIACTSYAVSPNINYLCEMAIGPTHLTQQTTHGNGGFWFVVLNRTTLAVEYNQVQPASSNNVVPNIGTLNTSDHLLLMGTPGVGLDNPPQGALFDFLDKNGAGYHLRRVEQFAQQFNCGSWGTYTYVLCSVLGDGNSPGFEDCTLAKENPEGPFLTIQLMPISINGQTSYTPINLANA